MEVVEKKKRAPRKIKPLPAVSQVEVTGEVKLSKIEHFAPLPAPNYDTLNMCPYTNLIPLEYLRYGNISSSASMGKWSKIQLDTFMKRQFGKYTPEELKLIEDRINEKERGLKLFMSHVSYISDLDELVKRYIHEDIAVNIKNIVQSWGDNSKTTLVEFFKNIGLTKFNLRTQHVISGSYSLFLKNNTVQTDLGVTPHVVACILPENYMYQKLHFLTTGQVDMSKIIILIDNDLQKTSFHNKAFRLMFNKDILPLIKNTSATVFYVPLQYIEENCFLGDKTPKSSNIFERKKEMESFIEEYKKSHGHIAPVVINTEMDFEEIRETLDEAEPDEEDDYSDDDREYEEEEEQIRGEEEVLREEEEAYDEEEEIEQQEDEEDGVEYIEEDEWLTASQREERRILAEGREIEREVIGRDREAAISQMEELIRQMD